MTERDVFEYFCGKYRVKAHIRKCYELLRPIDWGKMYCECGYMGAKSQDINYVIPFNKFFDTAFKGHGFKDLFWALTSYDHRRMSRAYPKFKYASNKWRYFYQHNIVLKPGCLNIGDKVHVKIGGLGDGVVQDISIPTATAAVKFNREGRDKKKKYMFYNNNETLKINFNQLCNEDGKPLNVEYAISERGKIVKE